MAGKEAAPQCENETVVTAEAKQTGDKGSSPKSSPSKIETNEALQHLVQGKRHLLVRDVNSAVNSLQEACRLLAEQYGETADPCGEAYFFYGKALLELSRIETGVLGNALDGVPDGDDADTSQTEDPDKLSEEEKQKVVEEVDEALEENFTTLENARKSNQASDGKAASKAEAVVEGDKQGGDVEGKTVSEADKIVDNGVDMETGGEEKAAVFEKPVGNFEVELAGNTTVDSEVTKDDEKKGETEPIDEAMEVDGAVLSSAGGVAAAPTDSTLGDGRRHSGEIEPPTASEAKTAASGEGDGELTKTAGSQDAEKTEKGTATGDGKRRSWEIETPPAASGAKNISGGSDVGSAKTTGPEDAEMSEKESAAADEGRQSSKEMEAPLAASETKKVASGEGDTKTAGPEDAEMVEKKPDATGDERRRSWEIETPPAASEAKKASGGDGEIEDKPLPISGDSADTRPKDETAAAEAADVKPVTVDADTVSAEKTSDAAPVTKTADASTVETASGEASATEKTTEEKVNGDKPGESTEGDEEDDDEAEGEDQPAEAEDAEKEETEGEPKKGDGETVEGEEEEGDAAKEGETSQDCDTEEGEGEGEGEGAKEGEDEEEDVPNIQLAWEVLELAKVIFTRQAKDKPSDLKLSEVYQKLGEVSIEAENYSQAVDDLNNCLAIQKKHLEADDRLIAETHYHLGVAHSLANQYSEAIAAFQASVDTILARVQRLQRQIVDREQGKKIEHEDPFYKEENEIKELEGLLPDMKEKIADMRDMKSEAQKKIAEIFAASGGAGPSTSAAPISPVKAIMTSRPAASAADGEGGKKETHSIGHLVKRKRLSDPTDEEAKRAKQENGHNGINGHAGPA